MASLVEAARTSGSWPHVAVQLEGDLKGLTSNLLRIDLGLFLYTGATSGYVHADGSCPWERWWGCEGGL